MQTRYLYLLKYILPITDIIMLNMIYIVSYYLTEYLGKSVSYELWQHYIVVCNLIWMFNSAIFGLYTEYGARRLERIYRGTYKSILLHAVLFAVYLMLAKDVDFSRTFLLVFYGLLVIGFLINRFVGTAFQFILVNKFHVTKKVALIGNSAMGSRLALYLTKQRNIDFYGYLDEQASIYDTESGNLSDITIAQLDLAAQNGVKDLYVSVAPERMPEVKSLLQVADAKLIRLKFIPDLEAKLAAPYTISYMGGEFPIITLRHEPLENMGNRFKKRAFDFLFSGFVIVFILSWLYPLIALLIKLENKGPVLFRQLRSGRNDEPFWCLKFRSMKVNADSDKKQATKDDDRITKIGRFLRKTSLDEMPQFFNVFYGSMSVVGPRPHMLSHTEEYKAIVNKFMVRHFVKPGITGWAQVNGFRGETKRTAAMENRVEHDIWYMENWSSMLDVKIIFLTVINALRGEDNAF
ncbi:undecaprenyl-phosphate glucose phosphotransferase [Pedobacter duraquae]|uniref:Putative colanic acid biosynthesis UDP-glucose lipid carrier transferase n=1 Tax=Pedobacter duraquae TaxID=425511 RepID=A0A4R6IBQ7_9SPHI|nr:undecaprenyl-phosphate glucose phosphotransferase [Pedobacter duraquae]TDO19036.1 putative colanic acid biosynthesis UDP-glucose lipid carrier transferase [Pedobacter duraquae]